MKLKIGPVCHYYAHVGVMAVRLENGLALGDTIRVRGRATNITQIVDFIQIEHLPVRSAKAGDTVGIKTEISVHPGDIVYKLGKELVAAK